MKNLRKLKRYWLLIFLEICSFVGIVLSIISTDAIEFLHYLGSALLVFSITGLLILNHHKEWSNLEDNNGRLK